jgi:hypothetical protein
MTNEEQSDVCGMWRAWEQEKWLQGLGGKTWGKESLGTSEHKREDNFKMDLKEIGWQAVECLISFNDMKNWQDIVNTAVTFVLHKMWGGDLFVAEETLNF